MPFKYVRQKCCFVLRTVLYQTYHSLIQPLKVFNSALMPNLSVIPNPKPLNDSQDLSIYICLLIIELQPRFTKYMDPILQF